MAGKKKAGICYVYLLKDGDIPIYVGKGVKGRAKASQRKHGGQIHILEDGLCDDDAFSRERYWIAELTPLNNLCPGGNGGRATPRSRFDLPKSLEGEVKPSEWRKFLREQDSEEAEIERVGSKKHTARFLCRKLDERNCEKWGVSKIDLNRLREVAYG